MRFAQLTNWEVRCSDMLSSCAAFSRAITRIVSSALRQLFVL